PLIWRLTRLGQWSRNELAGSRPPRPVPPARWNEGCRADGRTNHQPPRLPERARNLLDRAAFSSGWFQVTRGWPVGFIAHERAATGRLPRPPPGPPHPDLRRRQAMAGGE